MFVELVIMVVHQNTLLTNHTENGCVKMSGSQIVLPEKGEVMKFENYNYKFRHPFTIIADFECCNHTTDNENKRVHKPNSYGYCYIRYRCISIWLSFICR